MLPARQLLTRRRHWRNRRRVRRRTSGRSVYNYFRDYDAVTGRYVQSDPIGLAGGLNTYLYANANPLRYSDPLGLETGAAYRAIYEIDGGLRSRVAAGPAANFSVGVGGLGMFGPMSLSADFGLAVDTELNMCVYLTTCTGVGFQTPLAAAGGLVGGAGIGEICSGESSSQGPFWVGGQGIVGEGEVLFGPSGGSFTRGLIGVGPPFFSPAGAGYKWCHTFQSCL